MDHRACKVTPSVNLFMLIVIFSCWSRQFFCFARDTIAYGDEVRENGETLVSAGDIFELGFFNLSERRYVGIWYKSSPGTIIWVANRDKPVYGNNNGVFVINKAGSLQVLNISNEESLWSSPEIENLKESSDLTAKLLDNGNLVLGEGVSLWESFNYPTDTFMAGMVMGTELKLTSWKGEDDPAEGGFYFMRDKERENEYLVMNGSVPHWKSGVNLVDSDKIPDLISNMLSNSKLDQTANSRNNVTKQEITFKVNGKVEYSGSRLVVMFNGTVSAYHVSNESDSSLTSNETLIWSVPSDQCSVLNFCGNFGICNAKNNIPACQCFDGFEPTYSEQWGSGDFSRGCKEKGTQPCGKSFLNLSVTNVMSTESSDSASNETECKERCLGSYQCKCKAYSFQEAKKKYRRKSGSLLNLCSIWIDTLQGIQKGYGDDVILYVRLSDSEPGSHPPSPLEGPPQLSNKNTPLALIVGLTVLGVALMTCTLIGFIVWRRTNLRNRRSGQRNRELLKLDTQKRIDHLINSCDFVEKDDQGIDVPFIDFDVIVLATNDFSDANKLGQGGYGPVYKGTFAGGQEIAVKRLSTASGQGSEEFKNEVVLIAKLQHRNLVRLRGYCMKGDEKILLYEYMPNRSLDSFIFDNKTGVILDWEKRFNIILGVARGLLYLHQDSRLRIIHRDLKTSNILLDRDMEPKISDFGLARIVGGQQTEANTNRVVGTYGYMSPEYALEGVFSVKSDVFSFGVVLLEIVSGKRNTRLVQSEQQQLLSLLGYAWRLWTENKATELVDPALLERYDEEQLLKCIKIGLLCVQEDPSDRPTISTIVTMLDSESASVPTPQQPAFTLKRVSNMMTSSSSSSKLDETRAQITTTLEQGR